MGARGKVSPAAMAKALRAPKTLPAPKDLSERSRKVWDVIVPRLGKAGALEEVDIFLIVTYCDAVALQQTAMDHIRKEGPIIISDSRWGRIKKKSPWVNAWIEGGRTAAAAGRQLGIGFLSRARLQGFNLDDDDEHDGSVNGKKTDELDQLVLGRRARRVASGDDDE